MKLSACYMVKNEEENLPGSIRSVCGAVDELIVVDTGSTDCTRTLAAQYGATVYDYPWGNDFSAPRNYAISRATGDWIIFLDADESFVHPECVRQALEILLASQPQADAVMLKLREVDLDDGGKEIGQEWCLRIFQNRSNLRYAGRIHENIQNRDKPLSLLYGSEDLTLNHTGYSAQRIKEKLRRNLVLLQQEIAEGGEQPRHYMFLADCYFGLADYENALHYAKMAVDSPVQAVAGASSVYHRAIESMRQLHYPLADMLVFTERAVCKFPQQPEFYAEQGMVLCAMGRLEEADRQLAQSLDLFEQDRADLHEASYMRSAADKVYARKAELEMLSGRVAEAWQHARQSLLYDPKNETARKIVKDVSANMINEKKEKDIIITACYIVKNEAAVLAQSLACLSEQVDEILIADTGSTDDTIAIGQASGATVWSIPWQNNFSQTRNTVLDSAVGDWIVFLDADEFLSEETAFHLRTIIKTIHSTSVKGILMRRIDIDVDRNNTVLADAYVLRVFRNCKQLRYEGAIHEELTWKGGAVQPVVTAAPGDLLLYHTGYSSTLSKAKAERNLELLLQELQQTARPGRIYGYLADAYFGVGDEPQAEHFARLDIQQGRRATTYASRSYRILLQLLAAAAGRRQERFEACQAAVRDFPEIPEFRADYAECLASDGNYGEASVQMEQVLKSFREYEGIEPMLFNEQMADQAQNRLLQWQKKVEHPGAAAGQMAADLLLRMMWRIKDLCMALLGIPSDIYQAQHFDEVLPDKFRQVIRIYHKQDNCQLDFGAYEVLLREVLQRGWPALKQSFVDIGMRLPVEQRILVGRTFFEHQEWKSALRLWQDTPVELVREDVSFLYEIGVACYQIRDYKTATEYLKQAKGLETAPEDVDAYLNWCQEGEAK